MESIYNLSISNLKLFLASFLSFLSSGCVLGCASLEESSEKYNSEKRRDELESEGDNTENEKRAVENPRIDPVRIELGYGLIPLAQSSSSDNLFQTIPVLRRELDSELGIKLPKVRVRDNLSLKPFEYSIILKEVELARGDLFIDRLLAINTEGLPEIEGIDTIEPSTGFPAKWIDQNLKKEAKDQGYKILEPKDVLTTHLGKLIKENLSEILDLQEVKDLLEELRSSHPSLVEEVYPGNLPLTTVQEILHNLLRENVPIKDLLTIFEVLAEKSSQIKDPLLLTELVRSGLKRTITQKYSDPEGKITVFTLDPKLEQKFFSIEDFSIFNPKLKPEPTEEIVHQCRLKMEELKDKGIKPVVLLSSRTRLPFRKFIEGSLPDLGVLSYEEIIPKTKVYSEGVISLEENPS